MGEYSVGNETKKVILEACRKLFYEKGVNATSYEDICSEANVNRGLIPYHFKGKINIASAVYDDFYEQFNEGVGRCIEEENVNVLSIVCDILIFRELKRNKNFCRFCNEVESNIKLHVATMGQQRQFIERILEYNDIKIDEGALRTIACLFEGTERELISALYSDYLVEPIDKIVYRDAYFVFSTLGFEKNEINDFFEKALQHVETLEVHVTETFKVEFYSKR